MNSIFSEENLQVLTTVARCHSFSQAAVELGVTTSAISYAVKRMETRLDVQLFVRHARRVELTGAGLYFHQKAVALLEDFRAIEQGVDAIAQGVEARVRICINHLLFTPHHTARLLQLLKKQFPTCQVAITHEVYNGVWDAFIRHQATIAIGAPDTPPEGGGIDSVDIGSVRWQFAISPDHPLAGLPQPIGEDQLRRYTNIMVADTALTLNQRVGWLLHGQEAILVPDFYTKCQCQILGEGIGFLPDYIVREAGDKLVTRQVNNPRRDSRMLLVTRQPASGQVTRWVRQHFAPGGVLHALYRDLLHGEDKTDGM